MRYVDVTLPLPLHAQYTYALPDDIGNTIQPGCRVIVPFGNKKIYTAIVMKVHTEQPQGYQVKNVMECLDVEPILLPVQLRLWQWIADYYLSALGDVYKAALPSGMKLESESKIVLNEDFESDVHLTTREQAVLDSLIQTKDKEKTVQQLQRELGGGCIMRVLRQLLDKGAIHMKEEVRRSYKPKTEQYVRLSESFFSEEALNRAFDAVKRAPKQQELLLKYAELSALPAALHLNNYQMLAEVRKHDLLSAAGVAPAVYTALTERGVLQTYTCNIARLVQTEMRDIIGLSPLSDAQQIALDAIYKAFDTHQTVLLHGVTSSGKTEVYIHLINQMIAKDRQVLYLVPEIALTTQLTSRLYKVFGDRMGVYHSKFSDNERVEIWQKQLSDKPYDVLLGVRSSVFLPFQRLGLVIVDEEHEQTYKQQDPAPRYHARNTALVLAHMTGAKTLLGTATPSLETYNNALEGKYGLVELKERYRQVLLPEIEVVDIKELQRKRRMTGMFSPRLLEEIRKAIEMRRQVILFQNRRGYAPVIECHTCGWVPKCPNCDVSLTYHKGLHQLTCHYCGFVSPYPHRCPACGETELLYKGFGTEKVEDDLKLLFPEIRVARMDLDTTRTRTGYEQIISDFQHGKTDVLIGTQMVTKGLDFENVSVVGILNADTMLNQPDFRSYERAFQMMSQVAGRAGRRQVRGLVILQTKSPDSPVITQVVNHDYLSLYREQMFEREQFCYPPYCRLIYVYMKHRDSAILDRLAGEVAVRLRKALGSVVLGPDQPPVARVQTLYIRKIVLKIGPGLDIAKVRGYLLQLRQDMIDQTVYHSAVIYYDADPM